MKKEAKQMGNILIRYLFLLAFGLILLLSSLFYKLLLPITIYPTNWLLNLFYSSIVFEDKILINSIAIEIIPACVAVSAYFLLLVLNLTTPMNTKKRVYSFLFSFSALLLINILRIFFLAVFLINNLAGFEIFHQVLWFGLSIVFVVGVWFLTAWLFKIKSVPAYTDIKFLLKLAKNNKL